MLKPITGNLDYMSMSIDVMQHVKELIHGLHVAYMKDGINSPDVIYVKNHKAEIFQQLESYRDQIHTGHDLINSIKICMKDPSVKDQYFEKTVNNEDLLDLLTSTQHLVNSTVDAFNTSIKLLDSLGLIEEKEKLEIERVV